MTAAATVRDARGVGVTASVVGAILLLIWLASGAFIVPEGQVGLVTTFGELSHKTGAGFNWRWPAPFQADETVNVAQVQTRKSATAATSATSRATNR